MEARRQNVNTPAFVRRDRLAREAEEAIRLAPAAQPSAASRGRARPEPQDEFRTVFERDRDRILHSKAFRRLKHKTQVFLNPEGDHYITRLSHTLQVTQIARSLAAALSLNESLAEAIALGHDVGHSPFGHTGEEALSPYLAATGGWHHAAQSVRILTTLEPLNLSAEVLDGVRAHSWKIQPPPHTQEALCVRYADRIAYLTHDALDAMRAGALSMEDFPPRVIDRFGDPGRLWVGEMIDAVVSHSLEGEQVAMDPETLEVMHELRAFMFEHVYFAPGLREHAVEAIELIQRLVDYHLENPDELPEGYRDTDADRITQVADYISGMTDRYAVATHERLFGSPGMADPVL